MRLCVSIFVAGLAAACAKSAVIPMAKDTFQITASAAPLCGSTGAQQVALRQTAIETIRRGYDSFIIVGGGYRNNIAVVGHTPVVANTSGYATATAYGNQATAYGRSTTTYSGGQPIIAGTHDQGLVVKMFKADDPSSANAVSARDTLGPKWQEAVSSDTFTCVGF